jgi:hypothetical protein
MCDFLGLLGALQQSSMALAVHSTMYIVEGERVQPCAPSHFRSAAFRAPAFPMQPCRCSPPAACTGNLYLHKYPSTAPASAARHGSDTLHTTTTLLC